MSGSLKNFRGAGGGLGWGGGGGGGSGVEWSRPVLGLSLGQAEQ